LVTSKNDAQPTGALQAGKNAAFAAQPAKCGSELTGFSIDRQFSHSVLLLVDVVLARILL
jgi:hypothetical protein